MDKITVLYVFGFPIQLGGHYNSALAMAKSLISMGHRVIALYPGGSNDMTQEFLSAGVTYFSIPEFLKYNISKHSIPRPFGASRIENICREKAVDIVHAQDFKSISASYLAAVRVRKGFVFTKAGGPVNEFFPPSGIESIFYSQELVDGMASRYSIPQTNITLIMARIDMDVYKPVAVDASFIKQYQLPVAKKVIVMAVRLSESKLPWIDTLFKCADGICNEFNGVKIIIAGDGPLFNELKERAAAINRKGKDGPMIHLIGPIFNSSEINQLYNFADIVVGNGRGILEAMACGKPVIVLGENGEGVLINEYNVDEISKYNFSGRHFRYSNTSENLFDVLKRILSDEEELRRAGYFSYEYIKKYMDASIGAYQLVRVYEKALIRKIAFADYLLWNLKLMTHLTKTSLKHRFFPDLINKASVNNKCPSR